MKWLSRRHAEDNRNAACVDDAGGNPMLVIRSGERPVMKREVRTIIESVVRERFADAAIESVRIVEDEDSDGDAVFRVTVILDAGQGTLDPHKTASIVRHLRHKLIERHEEGFPIMTFVSKAEDKGLATEAA